MGRNSSRSSYDDEFDGGPTRSPRESYIALGDGDSDDVATRFARPSAPAIADSDEVATRYGRGTDSDDVATRFARPAAHAFVAPAEIEGERSPAMRARRQSYVAPSERRSVPAPPRPSQAELERRSRASFVASSERNDFASSAPDVDEVTSWREPAPRPSYARVDSVDGHYSSSEIEELSPPSVDYDALKSYLFDDISRPRAVATPPHKRTNPAFPPPPHDSSFLPPPPPRKSTHPSFAPHAHAPHAHAPHAHAPGERAPHEVARHEVAPPAYHPTQPSAQRFAPPPPYRATQASFAPPPAFVAPPPASPSSSTPVAPLMPRPPMRSAMQMPVQHDSYIDSSWIVPTPAFPPSAPMMRPEGFRFSLGFLAAAITAVAALVVMIGAVIFVRSDDASMPAPTFAMRAPLDESSPFPLPATTALAPQTATAPATAQAPTIISTEATRAPAKTATPSQLHDAPKAKPAKKKVAVAATDDDDAADETPAATKPAPKAEKTDKVAKKTGKVGDKTVEQMLADLGEEQLRR